MVAVNRLRHAEVFCYPFALSNTGLYGTPNGRANTSVDIDCCVSQLFRAGYLGPYGPLRHEQVFQTIDELKRLCRKI